MSEELNPKQLPHEMLMTRYGLSMEQMGKHTKQLKTDLDRTLRLVLNKAKNGAVKLTPATQSKIETYDRYIWRRKGVGKAQEKVKVGTKTCRFAQFPDGNKAIMPSVLQELLAGRKATRKFIKYKHIIK